MRPYEVMVIFDASTEPPAIQAVVDQLVETVRTNEGTPGHIDRWGRRAFAYEVKHRSEGYYVLVEFAGESRTVTSLDRLLTLADEVLRHKVIRLPEKAAARAAATARRGRAGRGADGGGRGTDRSDGASRRGPSSGSGTQRVTRVPAGVVAGTAGAEGETGGAAPPAGTEPAHASPAADVGSPDAAPAG